MPCDAFLVTKATVFPEIGAIVASDEAIKALCLIVQRLVHETITSARREYGVALASANWSVVLGQNGALTVRASSRVGREVARQTTQQIEAAVARVGGLLAQRRLLDRLRSRYPVLEDRATAQGGRALTLEV